MSALVSAPYARAVRAPLPSIEAIQRLQSAMVPMSTPLPEPEHIFHDGWYERRLLVPADMLIVGKIHRHPHPIGVIRGDAWIISPFGRDRVGGGYWSVSTAGIKRVALAIEDTLFVTLHRNPKNERDLARIEADHIEPEAFSLRSPAVREVLQ